MDTAKTSDEQQILKPREGTAAQAQAFLDDRRAEGKRVDPQTCEIVRCYVQVVDPYDLFEVPDEWGCLGRETFVRNVPDGSWVRWGDLPEDIAKALDARLGRSNDPPVDEGLPF